MRKAQDLCLPNERVTAQDAVDMGLITRLAAEGALAVESALLADELARGATSAFGATKNLLAESTASTLEAHLDAESRAIAAQARTADGKEGIAAFLAKRAPDYARRN